MPIFTASMMSFGSPRQQAKCSSVFFPAVVMAVWETGKGFLSLKKVLSLRNRLCLFCEEQKNSHVSHTATAAAGTAERVCPERSREGMAERLVWEDSATGKMYDADGRPVPWFDMVEEDRGAVFAYILSGYKMRIDDAYAAVGMMRGVNKARTYPDDPWCRPEADLRRFVLEGERRGALPSWWNPKVRERFLKDACDESPRIASALSLSGLEGAEEPCDALERGGRDLLNLVREIGDAFEGPPPWGTSDRRPDRDRVSFRKTLRRQGDFICDRCRSGIPDAVVKGCGDPCEATCPMCGFQGWCPKSACKGGIEEGRCVECNFAPKLYVLVDTVCPPEFAKLGAKLAADLELPELELFAVGTESKGKYPRIRTAGPCPESRDAHLITLDDHLSESVEPLILVLKEAALMFQAALKIIGNAIGISLDEIASLGVIPPSSFKDLCQRATASALSRKKKTDMLKAGVQLAADAWWSHEQCVAADRKWPASYMLMVSLDVLGRHCTRVHGREDEVAFRMTMQMARYASEKISSSVMAFAADLLEQSRTRAREVLSYIIRNVNWQQATNKRGAALESLRFKRFYSKVLLLRSHDQLVAHGDIAASSEDLDTAIAFDPDSSLHSLRAPLRLSAGRLREASADLETAVLHASADAPHLHGNLFALAAIYVRRGDIEQGRALFERARVAEARHAYLYGRTRPGQPEDSGALPVMQFYKYIAVAVFGSGDQQGSSGGEGGGNDDIAAADARRFLGLDSDDVGNAAAPGVVGVVGLPGHERDAFVEAARSQNSRDEAKATRFAVGDAVLIRGVRPESATVTEAGAAEDSKVCSVCKQAKSVDRFSGKQWKERAHSRKCLECIANRSLATCEHNGALGYVDSDLQDERYAVVLAPDRVIRILVKPANLRSTTRAGGGFFVSLAHRCATCGRKDSEEKLKYCQRCHQVRYCSKSKSCQRIAWRDRGHRSTCASAVLPSLEGFQSASALQILEWLHEFHGADVELAQSCLSRLLEICAGNDSETQRLLQTCLDDPVAALQDDERVEQAGGQGSMPVTRVTDVSQLASSSEEACRQGSRTGARCFDVVVASLAAHAGNSNLEQKAKGLVSRLVCESEEGKAAAARAGVRQEWLS